MPLRHIIVKKIASTLLGNGGNRTKNGKSSEDDLDTLAKWSKFVIFEAGSIFPFKFFPDRITICPNRITITYRGLFSREEFPIPIENLTGARVYRNLFFASLIIETFRYDRPAPLQYLKIHDARLARRYILALVECRKNGIDLTKHDISTIRDKLKEIGMVRERTGQISDL
jgi:hypothetical protein